MTENSTNPTRFMVVINMPITSTTRFFNTTNSTSSILINKTLLKLFFRDTILLFTKKMFTNFVVTCIICCYIFIATTYTISSVRSFSFGFIFLWI